MIETRKSRRRFRNLSKNNENQKEADSVRNGLGRFSPPLESWPFFCQVREAESSVCCGDRTDDVVEDM